MTTENGIIQFSKINQPDILTGYTLDDNARAMIAICLHYELTFEEIDLELIANYLNFIEFCLNKEGYFLNYVDENLIYTDQNFTTNLADSNGRAIWALGYLIANFQILPTNLVMQAELIMEKALIGVAKIHSTRAMAFVIKGLYYQNKKEKIESNVQLIIEFSNRLVEMYKHESDQEWKWFESYLTYANSLLPESLLCAWSTTGIAEYKSIAKSIKLL